MRLTTTGAIIGTPRYMAPEQLDGAVADERSDQFSLCLALWEALYGEHPFAPAGVGFPALREAVLAGVLRAPPSSKVPVRVKQALTRGLARDPAARFASVRELLVALDVLAPSRRWVWGVLAGAGVIAAASIAYGTWQAGQRGVDRGEKCTGSAALLRGVWDDNRRADIGRAFAGSNLPYAGVARTLIDERFEDWSHRWVDARTRACRATNVYGEQSEATLEAEMRCFDGARISARALVDVFAQATPDEIGNVNWALGRLPRPERCTDPGSLLGQAPPSDPTRARMVDELTERLAEAKALAEAGDTPSAIILLGPISVEAQLTGHVATIAKVEAALGEAEVSNGDAREARGHLERAITLAEEAKDDSLRGDLAVELASAAYFDSRYDDARRWLAMGEAVMHRIDDDGPIANILEIRGEVDFYDGELPRARAELEESVRRFEKQPPQMGHATALVELGEVEGVLGDPNRADGHYQRAIELATQIIGAGHPTMAKLLGNYGAFLVKHDRLDDALPMFQRALAIKEATLGPDDPSLGFPIENIAVVERRKGDLVGAERDYARALALFEQVPDAAYAIPAALDGLAMVRMEQRKYAEAVLLLERALALRGNDKPTLDDGENQLHLARAMWLVGKARDDARRHALLARQIFKDLGPTAKEHLADAERWLAAPDRYQPGLESSF